VIAIKSEYVVICGGARVLHQTDQRAESNAVSADDQRRGEKIVHGVPNKESRMACILVIDDDRLLRGTVELILKSEGHRVASARDGHEGFQRFRSDRFDLVACDIFMPNLEGLETIRRIRDVSTALPIIAFTGGPAQGSDPGTDSRGATEMLAKPFRRQELLDLVRRCLHTPGSS
jgi:CheY-like chemotaxis protein